MARRNDTQLAAIADEIRTVMRLHGFDIDLDDADIIDGIAALQRASDEHTITVEQAAAALHRTHRANDDAVLAAIARLILTTDGDAGTSYVAVDEHGWLTIDGTWRITPDHADTIRRARTLGQD